VITRRAVVTRAVAATSVGAGIGVAWLRQGAPADNGKHEAPVDIWRLSFARPGGGDIALSSFKGHPLLLNFWATWCAPCVRELPLLDRFYRQYRAQGWEVLGLAVQTDVAVVQEFLIESPVTFSLGLAGVQGVDLSRALGNLHGALPFSVAFNRQGRPVRRKLGTLMADELNEWVALEAQNAAKVRQNAL
jgi:thiol-disulfide isomerase/thioredoxin